MSGFFSPWIITTNTVAAKTTETENKAQLPQICMSYLQLIMETIHCLPYLKVSLKLFSVRRSCPWLPISILVPADMHTFNNKVDDNSGKKLECYQITTRML